MLLFYILLPNSNMRQNNNKVGILKYFFIATLSIFCIKHITFGVGIK